VHRPADLLPLDWDHLQCKSCKATFERKPDPERREGIAGYEKRLRNPLEGRLSLYEMAHVNYLPLPRT
jgi:hypothetical protein